MLIVFESIANLKIDALPEYFGQQCAGELPILCRRAARFLFFKNLIAN